MNRPLLLLFLLLLSLKLFSQEAEKPALNAPSEASLQKKRFFLSLGAVGDFSELGYTGAGMKISPRINLLRKYSDVSVSFGLPMTAAISPEAADPFFGEMAVMGELNIGHLATKNFYKPNGVAFGGGYNTNILDGKLFSGGAASFAFRSWLFRRSFEVRYMGTFSNDRGAKPLHEVSVSFCLGNWVRENRRLNKVSGFVKPFRKR